MPETTIRLLVTALFCSAGLWPGALTLAAEGSAGGSMNGMRTMMQQMMGNVLPPGIDPALLPQPHSAGARLLERYCTQCHRLPGPGMHTAPEWPNVIDRMDQRMRMMQHMSMMGPVAVPNRVELDTITVYMQKFAQVPIDPAKYPDLNTAAGEPFRATCARCHALPDPVQHTAGEWPAVVARMQHNMTVMGRAVPDQTALSEIIAFLQQHAHDQTGPGPKR